MRWPVLLALCACDAVFGLSSGDTDCVHPFAIYVAPGDFDGDGIDNCHDLCPYDDDRTNGDNTDSDGDGIPDRCDPDADGGGTAHPDCLLVFDVFTDNNVSDPLAARWTTESSDLTPWTWGVCPHSGQTAACSPIGKTESVMYFTQPLPTASQVQADVVVVAEATADDNVIQVIADGYKHDNDLDGRSCGFVMASTGVAATLRDLDKGSATATFSTATTPPVYDLNDELIVQYTPHLKSDCTQVLSSDGMPDITAPANSPAPIENNLVGVRTSSIDAEVQDVRVLGTDCKAP